MVPFNALQVWGINARAAENFSNAYLKIVSDEM